LHPKISGFGYSIGCGYPKLTQNPTFTGFDTQKKPNTQKFWVRLYVFMDNILHNLDNYTSKIFGHWVFFWVSKPENVGFWVWAEFWVATSNTVPKPRNFWVQLDENQ
jgi:hypothetical protein